MIKKLLFIIFITLAYFHAYSHVSALGWTQLTGTALVPSGLCPSGTSGDCSAVIEAWSGGVADTLRNRLIFYGGGHGDYNGNEVYAIYPAGTTPVGIACSSGTAPAICRIKDRSASLQSVSAPSCSLTADGTNMNSRHTYASPSYLSGLDLLYTMGGSITCATGAHFGDTWTLDLANITNNWIAKDPANGSGTKPRDICSGCGSSGQGPWVYAVWDSARQLVFTQSGLYPSQAGAYLWSWVPSTNTYAVTTANALVSTYASWVIDPLRHRLYIIGPDDCCSGGGPVSQMGTARISYIDISSGGSYANTIVNLSGAGCNGLAGAPAPGVAYDSAIDRIVGWPNFGNTVYLFDPATGTCTTQTFSGGPPDSRNASNSVSTTGTFGRFQYFPSLDTFVVVNDGSTDAYALSIATPVATVLTGSAKLQGNAKLSN
ncbi:MAG: hypothetical protein V4473_02270 [Patescibacteria group bacterium]